MVREALWGKPGAFDANSPFYRALQGLTQVRNRTPALRYGRQYFRPISGNRQEFGVSRFPQGVLAFSRILNEEEVVVLANTQTGGPGWSGYVLVDWNLNPEGAAFQVLFSNKGAGEVQGPEPAETAHGALVHEVDGDTSRGSVRVIKVHLKPMEFQVLGR